MAERRMFSKSVVNSARFLRMPQTSRLLYYDLGMAADDDGIVEAFTVIRTTGAAEDDLRVLASKGFVIVLNEDLVSYITSWKENNWIRAERKRPSIYADLLVKIADGRQAVDICLTTDGQMVAEDSIGKDRLVEDNRAGKPPTRSRFIPPTVEEVRAYCQKRNNDIDPERFVAYYTANGWVQSKGKPIRDWKACVVTWEKNNRQSPAPLSKSGYIPPNDDPGNWMEG